MSFSYTSFDGHSFTVEDLCLIYQNCKKNRLELTKQENRLQSLRVFFDCLFQLANSPDATLQIFQPIDNGLYQELVNRAPELNTVPASRRSSTISVRPVFRRDSSVTQIGNRRASIQLGHRLSMSASPHAARDTTHTKMTMLRFFTEILHNKHPDVLPTPYPTSLSLSPEPLLLGAIGTSTGGTTINSNDPLSLSRGSSTRKPAGGRSRYSLSGYSNTGALSETSSGGPSSASEPLLGMNLNSASGIERVNSSNQVESAPHHGHISEYPNPSLSSMDSLMIPKTTSHEGPLSNTATNYYHTNDLRQSYANQGSSNEPRISSHAYPRHKSVGPGHSLPFTSKQIRQIHDRKLYQDHTNDDHDIVHSDSDDPYHSPYHDHDHDNESECDKYEGSSSRRSHGLLQPHSLPLSHSRGGPSDLPPNSPANRLASKRSSLPSSLLSPAHKDKNVGFGFGLSNGAPGQGGGQGSGQGSQAGLTSAHSLASQTNSIRLTSPYDFKSIGPPSGKQPTYPSEGPLSPRGGFSAGTPLSPRSRSFSLTSLPNGSTSIPPASANTSLVNNHGFDANKLQTQGRTTVTSSQVSASSKTRLAGQPRPPAQPRPPTQPRPSNQPKVSRKRPGETPISPSVSKSISTSTSTGVPNSQATPILSIPLAKTPSISSRDERKSQTQIASQECVSSSPPSDATKPETIEKTPLLDRLGSIETPTTIPSKPKPFPTSLLASNKFKTQPNLSPKKRMSLEPASSQIHSLSSSDLDSLSEKESKVNGTNFVSSTFPASLVSPVFYESCDLQPLFPVSNSTSKNPTETSALLEHPVCATQCAVVPTSRCVPNQKQAHEKEAKYAPALPKKSSKDNQIIPNTVELETSAQTAKMPETLADVTSPFTFSDVMSPVKNAEFFAEKIHHTVQQPYQIQQPRGLSLDIDIDLTSDLDLSVSQLSLRNSSYLGDFNMPGSSRNQNDKDNDDENGIENEIVSSHDAGRLLYGEENVHPRNENTYVEVKGEHPVSKNAPPPLPSKISISSMSVSSRDAKTSNKSEKHSQNSVVSSVSTTLTLSNSTMPGTPTKKMFGLSSEPFGHPSASDVGVLVLTAHSVKDPLSNLSVELSVDLAPDMTSSRLIEQEDVLINPQLHIPADTGCDDNSTVSDNILPLQEFDAVISEAVGSNLDIATTNSPKRLSKAHNISPRSVHFSTSLGLAEATTDEGPDLHEITPFEVHVAPIAAVNPTGPSFPYVPSRNNRRDSVTMTHRAEDDSEKNVKSAIIVNTNDSFGQNNFNTYSKLYQTHFRAMYGEVDSKVLSNITKLLKSEKDATSMLREFQSMDEATGRKLQQMFECCDALEKCILSSLADVERQLKQEQDVLQQNIKNYRAELE